MVELAIIAPVLLLLVMAAIDLGRIFASRITIANAARAGAFEAADNPSPALTVSCHTHGTVSRATCAAVNEAVDSLVSITPADVAVTCNPACAETYGNRVAVTVTGHFSLVTPIMWAFMGSQEMTFNASAEADVVYVPPPGVSPTAAPSATPTPTPTPSPTPTGTAAPTATPTAAPTPSPTPPCALPIAGFTWSQQNKNKPVIFVSTSSPTSGTCAITFWRWDYGDGTTDAGNFPTSSHTFPAEATTYTVVLSVTNPGGVISVSALVTTK